MLLLLVEEGLAPLILLSMGLPNETDPVGHPLRSTMEKNQHPLKDITWRIKTNARKSFGIAGQGAGGGRKE
ncbi:unnamed protein product [Arctogadus glacialis]